MANTVRIKNMRPDPPDLRDRLYNPTLSTLEPEFNARPFAHAAWCARVKDQHQTAACTGFALAALVETLSFNCWEEHKEQSEPPPAVSPFMLYYFARRYDDLRGSDQNDGSTARGAMKAWHKHGVCRAGLWPKMDMPTLAPTKPTQKKKPTKQADEPDKNWVSDAFHTPLGAYYRVDHQSIPDLHAALNEVGIVYVTAQIHAGWDEPNEGRIDNLRSAEKEGGHAFLLVGYDLHGFWIQNSWGTGWGRNGFAHLAYSDWLENGMDAWIGQLGVYITTHLDSLGQGLQIAHATEARRAAAGKPNLLKAAQAMLSLNESVRAQQISPYIVNLENNGRLSDNGKFRTSKDDLHDLAAHYLPNALSDWGLQDDDPVDVALYAHGGLVDEDSAAGTAAQWIPALYASKIFPVFFMWETGLLTTVGNILSEAVGLSSPAGGLRASLKLPAIVGNIKDRLLDFADDRLEGLAAPVSTPIWEEIKENAAQATINSNGGLRLLAKELNALPPAMLKRLRFHLIGHSAGAVFHAHLLPALLKMKLTVQGLYLMAPACRVDLFEEKVRPAFAAGQVQSYTQFHLNDKAEQDDDCARVYNRSLLYLVSNACERRPKTPLLGMQKFVQDPKANLTKPPSNKVKGWDFISAPTAPDAPLTVRCRATKHIDFDNDPDTLRAILERIKRQAK